MFMFSYCIEPVSNSAASGAGLSFLVVSIPRPCARRGAFLFGLMPRCVEDLSIANLISLFPCLDGRTNHFASLRFAYWHLFTIFCADRTAVASLYNQADCGR